MVLPIPATVASSQEGNRNYNHAMRAATILITTLLSAAPVLAQDGGQNTPQRPNQGTEQLQNQEQLNDRSSQRIERIRHEDAGSRVDELRVGGETKHINVQPKVGNLPAYEVQPGKVEDADGTNGRRVWRALQF